MATPPYRQRAGQLRSEIAGTSGAEGAAEELERLAQASRAITR